MKRVFKFSLLGAFLILCEHVVAYELDTHEGISGAATKSSVLKTDSDVLRHLGLRFSIEDNRQQFPNSEGEPRNILGLIGGGSTLEDTLSLARVRHHFFDPIRGRPLTVSGVGVGERSPDWALEDKEEISAQEFSLKDARRYLFEALTGPTEKERSRYFGLTFQTLGHAIHHLQDMAQPQHVRNDLHLDVPNVENLPGESPSLYETYTNTSIRSNAFGQLLQQRYSRVVAFATARKFWVTEEQSSPGRGTGEGMAEFTNNNFVSAGANFELQGNKIVSNPRYFLPVPESVSEVAPIEALLDEAERCRIEAEKRLCVTGNLIFVRTTIHDKYLNATQPNNRASTLSIFDADLRRYNKTYSCRSNELDRDTDQGCTADRIFTLNRFNFDAAHQFLIPRAVAYSAGLIDYFFRGRLEAHDVSFAESNGRVEVSLKVRNAIDAEKIPAWAGESLENRQGDPSQFVLTVKYKQGEEEGLIASGPAVFRDPEPIKPGETSKEVYTFDLPVLAEDATDIEYRIVFRGRLGQEDDAIAVGIVEHVSGFLVQPNYLPDDGLGGRRLITQAAGTWRLTQERGLQGGNIDWKGAYVNGRATKVLSWLGPKARYFPDRLTNPLGSAIYQNGERFAAAPCGVLGAAISRDGGGAEWLVVICVSGNADMVYRRPNTKSDLVALFDPVTNPEGWLEIGRLPWPENFGPANRPWFFNGDGTEAQTLREILGSPSEVGKTARLKVTITNAVNVNFVDLGNLPGATFDSSNVITNQTDSSGFPISAAQEQFTRVTGNYIVAVDYENNQEKLCVLSQETNDSLTKSAALSSYVENQRFATSRTLSCGKMAIAIEKSLNIVATELDTGNSGQSTPSGTREQSSRSERRSLIYLDARSDLFVYFSHTSAGTDSRTAVAHGSDGSEGICRSSVKVAGENNGSQSWKDIIEHGIQTLTAFEHSEDTQTIFNPDTARLIYNQACAFGLPTDTHVSRVFYLAVPVGERTDGSWAVDTDSNLFVSQTKGAHFFNRETGQFGTGEFYNFLTGGNPGVVVPTAPDKARYFPVYVVK